MELFGNTGARPGPHTRFEIDDAALATLMAGVSGNVRDARLLDNRVRCAIFELVAQQPGLILQQIHANIGVARGTAQHHLRRLEAGDRIVALCVGRVRHYYPKGTTAATHRIEFAALSAPTARRLAEEVLAHPGLAQEDLCVALVLQQSAASKQLRKLEAAGLVVCTVSGRRRRYRSSARLDQMAGFIAAQPPARASRAARPAKKSSGATRATRP